VYGAGGDAYEAGTLLRLQDGELDLALLGGRALVAAGLTGLEALHAPMLIDDTALAVAAARSPIAADALTQLSDDGITGLALWPESLRYLFTYPGHAPVQSPADLADGTVKTDVGASGQAFIEALGGKVWIPNDEPWETVVDAGLARAADSNLLGRGLTRQDATATGNVVLYPKFQVLIADADTLATLPAEHQRLLATVAQEVQGQGIDAVANEVSLAIAWCVGGGSVVLAEREQVQAFREVAAPLVARLRDDPEQARLLDGLRALKATTPRSVDVPACSPDQDVLDFPPTDPTGWQATLPAEGTYRSPEGTATWTFEPGLVTHEATEANGRLARCQASTAPTPDGRATQLTDLPGGTCGIGTPLVWRAAGDDAIELLVVIPQGMRGTAAELQDWMDYKRQMEQIWTRVQ